MTPFVMHHERDTRCWSYLVECLAFHMMYGVVVCLMGGRFRWLVGQDYAQPAVLMFSATPSRRNARFCRSRFFVHQLPRPLF